MRKIRVLAVIVPALLLVGLLASAVMAQEGTPPPYAGQQNPFPWDDAAALAAGHDIYQRSCSGCHGQTGGNIPGYDFSDDGFPASLEASPDYYFWILSEGRLSAGMPPFKSSLDEQQRWQALTYLWTLNQAPEPAETPEPVEAPAPAGPEGHLTLILPEQATSGQPLSLSVLVRDDRDRPIGDASVQFLAGVEFFTKGTLELGTAATGEDGVATLEYTPRSAGDIVIIARYQSAEATGTVSLGKADRPAYHAEAGIHLPTPGREIFIGPASARALNSNADAPTSAFRLPGGSLSWLLIVAAIILLIWSTYFRIVYQIFRIPAVDEFSETNTRAVPAIIMGLVVVVGITLLTMLLTGPYSHFHLIP